MIPDKRVFRITSAVVILVFAVMALIVGSVMGLSARNLLLAMFFTVVSSLVGAWIGWVIVRFLYSQLRNKAVQPTLPSKSEKPRFDQINIKYELDIGDALAFNSYNYYYSPQLGYARRLLRRALLLLSFLEVIVAIILVASFGREQLVFVLILSTLGVLTLIYYGLSPLLVRKRLKKVTERVHGHGKNKMIGQHEVHLTPDAIIDIANVGASEIRWNTVEYVAADGGHLFVAVRGGDPCVVPMRAFANREAFRQFADMAKAYHQAANQPSRGT